VRPRNGAIAPSQVAGRADPRQRARPRLRVVRCGARRARACRERVHRMTCRSHPPSYGWVMRVKFAVLLTLAAIGACGPSSSDGLADPSVRAKLRALALQASSANGVPSPKTMIAVYSPDDQAAESIISGDIVNDHVPVYVIEVTGGPFTCSSCSGPPGASPPQGNALTLNVDAQTYQVTDFGITPNVPDLTQISSDVVNLAQ
jgi:hypothetical protein